jgi:putative ABC transport system substrate-binding protein
MRRREFITLLGGSAATWPVVALAQKSAMPVIGFLSGIARDEDGLTAFRNGLSEFGYLEGRNISIEYRHADGDYNRLSSMAAELASLPVTLIVAVPSSPVALAAKKITSTIPIVFYIGHDPVLLGLVASYNRPGGNVTGIALNTTELTSKRVELLHELVQKPGPFAFLVNPSNPNVDVIIKTTEAARALGRELTVIGATTKVEIEAAFDEMDRQNVRGLVVLQEAYFTSQPVLIVSLAERHAIPSIYGSRLFPEIGGLMSYGPNRNEMLRLTGRYAGKILQGTNPADLPVIQPTKYELAINLKTAKALGLTVPPSLLVRADELIE